MAGDIGTAEKVVILVILEEVTTRRPVMAPEVAAAVEAANGRVLHRFGPRVLVTEDLEGVEPEDLQEAVPGVVVGAPAAVPQARLQEIVDGFAQTPEAPAPASATSGRLVGPVAVGVIIVEGPTDALRFTDEEQITVIAEVQNGLTWLATQTPGGSITWSWDVHVIEVGAQAQPLVAFQARHSGRWLDIANVSTANGAELIQWDWNGGHNQHFSMEPLDDGTYRLVAEHSGKVLDVFGASLDNGAQIIQWDWHGGDNQRFRL